MANDLTIQGEVVVSADKADAAFARVGAKADAMAKTVAASADKAGKAVDGIGAGAEKGAAKFTRAEAQIRADIAKTTQALDNLGKTASQKLEFKISSKGLDPSKFEPYLAKLREAEARTKAVENATTGWGGALSRVAPQLAAVFSGAAIGSFASKVVSVQREFDVLNSSLKTVTGSSAAAEREMAWLKDFAKTTPFGLAQATQGFVKMKALGLDPTRAALTSFGNTASAMGKGLNQMIEAVADASTGEFERLKEFGIKAKKEGDNVSLTFQGITTTIKNNSQEITKYLENIGNASFGGAMEERAKTLDGTIAALGDTWDELFRTVSSQNVGSLIFDSVTLANGIIEDATTLIRAFGGASSDAARDTGALAAMQGGVATFFETVAVMAAQTLYVLKQTGDTMGGVAAGYKAFFSFDFDAVRAIGAEMKANGEAARKEIDATTARILNARKEAGIYASYATRNASAATDPRRVDLGGSTTPRAPGVVVPTKAIKEAISEYDKLIHKLRDDLPKAAAEAEAAQHGYNKSQAEFIALAGSDVWAKFSNSQRATVAALFENKIASEQAGDAAKTLAKANLEAAQSREKYLTSLETGIDKLKADIASQEEATARMGLTKEAIAELDAAKLEMLATDLELQAIKAMDRNLDQQTYDALKKQAQAYRDLAIAKKGGAAREATLDLEKENRDAAKKATDEWEKASDEINRTLTDALMRGFESGEGFAKNMRDTIVNMFKTMVLRPVISAVLSPISGAINGMMGGGVQGAGGGGILGMASNASSLYSGYQALTATGGNFGAISGYASGTMSGANALGSLYANTTGTGINGLLATNGAYGTAGAGTASSAGMGAMGTAGIFAAVAGLVLNALGAFKSDKQTGTGFQGTLGGVVTPYEEWRTGGSLFSGSSSKKLNPLENLISQRAELQALRDQGLGTSGGAVTLQRNIDEIEAKYGDLITSAADANKILQDSYDGMRKSAGDMADKLGLSSESVRKFTIDLFGDREIELQGLDPAQKQAKFAEALATANNELAEQVLGSWVTTTADVTRLIEEGANTDADMLRYREETNSVTSTRYVPSEFARDGEKAIDTLTRLATSITAVNDTWDVLGLTMMDASLAGADMASRFIDQMGGMESFTAVTGSYYENFYSEAERMAKSTELLGKEFAKAGVEMPATKDAYRAMVTEALSAGEGSAELAAKLLKLAPAFAQSADYAAQAAEAHKAVSMQLGITTGATNSYIGALAAAAGGMDTLKGKSANFYDKFFTDAEKTANVIDTARAALAAVGLEMPTTAQGVRALMAAALGMGEAGKGTVIALLNATDGLDAFIGGINKVGEAAQTAAASFYQTVNLDGMTSAVRGSWADLIAGIVKDTDAANIEIQKLTSPKTSYEIDVDAIRANASQRVDDYWTPERKQGVYDLVNVKQQQQWQLDHSAGYYASMGPEWEAMAQWARTSADAMAAEITALTESISQAPPEIQALIAAETALLDARNKATADSTISGLMKEIAQLDMTPLEKELAGIADRADEYIKSLKDLGQGTDANIAAVNAWEQAMIEAAKNGGNAAKSLTKTTDDAYTALERAVGAQRDILKETITDLQSVFDMTRDAARDLYGEVESSKAQAAAAGNAFIDNALSNALATGYMPDTDALREAIEGVRSGITGQQYATSFDAERDRLVLAGKLSELKDIAKPQLTEAQKQLKVLDATLENARKQIDELRGINTSVLSVADAMSALATAIAAEKAGNGAGAGGGGAGGGGGHYQDVIDYGKANGGDAYYLMAGVNDFAAKKSNAELIAELTGQAVSDVWENVFGASAEYWQAVQSAIGGGAVVHAGDSLDEVLAKLPKLDVGTNYVQRSGAAIIHEGEAVVPKAFNPWAGGAGGMGGGNTARLEALVEGLTAEVQRLQEIVGRGVEHQRETAEILDNVTEGGNAMRSEVMA